MLINRKTKEVLLLGGRPMQRTYVSVEINRLYFTSAASRLCDLKVGLFIHFLNDGKEWKFYVNDDPDGFKLTPVRTKNGFHVTNTGLSRMIFRSMGFDERYFKKLFIEETNQMHDNSRVYRLSEEKTHNILPPVIKNKRYVHKN